MSAPQSALSPANEPVRGYRRMLISPTMAVLFVTVFLSVAGFSLPSPVFAPLLLEPQSGFFPQSSHLTGDDDKRQRGTHRYASLPDFISALSSRSI